MTTTVTGSCVASPPCSWESQLLGEGSFSLNDLSPLLSHWIGHQNCNSPCADLLFSFCVPLVMWFALWSAGVLVWPMWILSCGFVGWMWMWFTLISGVVWWGTSACWWSPVGLMWCVMEGLMAITPVCGTGAFVGDPWGGGDYPCVMTWSSLYMSHDDLSHGVCKNVIVTWNDFTCPCLYGSVWSLTWHGGFFTV